MSSLKRILSSRANGARSRGPITPAGKQASSLNAIRHGLLAKCVVLSNECRENFDILLAQHLDRYRPADDVELSVVEEMASAFWRMRRAWAIETRLHDDAINAREPGDEVGRITGAFTDLASSPALALLHRYEARLHHIRQRAFKNIHILRNTPPPPNEPTLHPFTRLCRRPHTCHTHRPRDTHQTRTPESAKRTHFCRRLTRLRHTRPRDIRQTRTPESAKRTHFCHRLTRPRQTRPRDTHQTRTPEFAKRTHFGPRLTRPRLTRPRLTRRT